MAMHEILKTLAIRNESATLVACPTCGRLEYDMVPTVKAVEAHIARLKVPITVAVMGCVVNGPAEARHADEDAHASDATHRNSRILSSAHGLTSESLDRSIASRSSRSACWLNCKART